MMTQLPTVNATPIFRFPRGPQFRVALETPGRFSPLLVHTDVPNGTGRLLEGSFDGDAFAGWTASAALEPLDEDARRWRCTVTINPAAPAEVAVTVALTDLGAEPHWLIPATFY